MIVVNTTFTGCAVQGDAWGPAVDVRGSTYFINCTFAGNLFLDNNHGGSGGFAECRYGGNVYFLNTVGAYNYNRAAPNGPLDGTGFPVKANADYTHVCFSADDGETWTDLYKDASADDSTLALITSSVKTGFLIIIR